MLLNVSNHPSNEWSNKQKQAAIDRYGAITDMGFPQIDPYASHDQIAQLAKEFEQQIAAIQPAAVHIMGEMTFTFALITLLKAIGLECVASTTERRITLTDEGRITHFSFVQFRTY
jgi:hypothetical protein